MKKKILSIILLGIGLGVNAQQNKIGDTGNVGIGVRDPKASLSIGNKKSAASLLNFDWTYETNWGGSANRWAGYIGFNAFRSDDHAKDYYYRTNDYTKRMVFESGNNGFRWLGESDIPDKGKITNSIKLNQLMILTSQGNAALYGKFEAKEIKVSATPTADFVFEKDYDLPTLDFIEKHIKEKKHLPEIAAAKEMEKNGVNIGEFQIQLLQKIEELTLYTIAQEKQIKELNQKVERNKNLENRLAIIEALVLKK